MSAFQKTLFPVKVHYFLINGAHAGVIPFISVYGKQMGIPADKMGYIYAIVSLVTSISKPLLGGLVDHFQKLKMVLVSLIVIDIIADMGLNFIPQPHQTSVNSTNIYLACYQNSTYILQHDNDKCPTNFLNCSEDCVASCIHCQYNDSICPEYNKSAVQEQFVWASLDLMTNCTNGLVGKCGSRPKTCDKKCFEDPASCTETDKTNSVLQMWLLAAFTAVIYICLGSIFSLSDAACFNALGSKPELYGRQRMWGTMGWGICALIAGYLNQVTTATSQTYNFSAGFFMLIVVFIIDMAIIPKLKLQKVKTSPNIFKDVGSLIVKPRIAHFLVQVFAIGMLVGFTRSYLFWYLRILNASQLVLGVTSTVQCFLGELPFFFFAGWIIAKIGHVNTFTMSFAAHGVRLMGYYFLTNPWWVLPIEILQGPCLGSFYTAMVSYAKVVAPEGTEATVQGLASGVFEGLGSATGSILGGYGFRVLGSRDTFLCMGISSLVLAILNLAYNLVTVRRQSTST